MLKETKNPVNVYVCRDDLKARGLNCDVHVNFEQFIKYDDMVFDIMENIDQIMCF